MFYDHIFPIKEDSLRVGVLELGIASRDLMHLNFGSLSILPRPTPSQKPRLSSFGCEVGCRLRRILAFENILFGIPWIHLNEQSSRVDSWSG